MPYATSEPGVIETPLAALIASAPPLHDLFDPTVVAWAGRLRAPSPLAVRRPGHEEVAAARIVRAVGGGPLRTFSGALNHECGLQHCLKADRALGWEGEGARDLLAMLDCEPDVAELNSESVRVEGIANGVAFEYTADVEVVLRGGARLVIEMKRGPDDLRDPHLRAVLATVTEVFRTIGVTFLVVFRDAVWRNRHHRRNCELLGANRLRPPSREEIAAAAAATRLGVTFGELAELLAPGRPASGRSKVRALALRGHVRIDLTTRTSAHTPVRPGSADTPTPPHPPRDREKTMRPHNKLTRNTVIRIRGADHVFNGRAGIGLNITNAATGTPYVEPNADGHSVFIDDGRLADMLATGEATLHSVGGLRAKLLADAGEVTTRQALAADPAVRKMLKQLDALDDAKVPDGVKAIERYMKEHWVGALIEEFGPADPAGTLRHWRRNRGVAGIRHPREMIRMWGRKRRGDYSSDFVAELLGQTILDAKANGEGHKEGYSLFKTSLELVNAGRHPEHEEPKTPFKIPHPDTYKRWWDEAIEEETELPALGSRGVDQNWHGAGRILHADYAMHRVVIDHTRLNLWAVAILDDGTIVALGRPWLSIANDVATGATVAHLISFIAPSAWTLGEMMRRMALPKRPPAEEAAKWPILVDLRGVPAELIVDSGAEFRSFSAERAFRASGVSVRWCKRKAPRQRARGERRVHIVADMICRGVKGCTMPIKEARRVGYDASKHAVAELDQIEGIANLAVALTNINDSKGIRGLAPAAAFERDANANGIRVMADIDAFLRDFFEWKPDHQITRSGVEVWGLRYGGDREVRALLRDLAGLQTPGRRRSNGDVTAAIGFAWNPLDIGEIYVWNPRSKTYVTLRCVDPEYADGMPKFVHDQIVEAMARDDQDFANEADRAETYARLVMAKRTLDPSQSLEARENAVRMLEATRLRQIAGNVVWAHTALPSPVSAYDLISHDRAALTAFDTTILDPRPSPKAQRRRTSTRSPRDSRDVGVGSAATKDAAKAPARRRVAKGGYR